jgi:predicted outer membrane repeat protein
MHRATASKLLPFQLFAVLLLLLSLSLAALKPVRAAGVVGNGTPASCTEAAFRDAVEGGGSVTFNCGTNPHTITISTSVVTTTTTVDGGGLITLHGENLRQIFLVLENGDLSLRDITLSDANFGSGAAIFIDHDATARLDGVTIRNSRAEGSGGGAIYNNGTLFVDHSVFEGNRANSEGGGIMNNGGEATISYSTFRGNRAQTGGGILNSGGQVTVTNSLFVENEATGNGGGVNAVSGSVNLTNVTFAQNKADRGGGLYTSGFVNILNSTFRHNRANLGGALFNMSETHTKNSIFADSWNQNGTATNLNCDGPSVISDGYNIVDDGTCVPEMNPPTPGDRRNTDPMLGPLEDNGGPTLSMLPLQGSPAIDGGTNVGCPATDQRGYARPVGATCDVGATEYGAEPPVVNYPVYLPLVMTGE